MPIKVSDKELPGRAPGLRPTKELKQKRELAREAEAAPSAEQASSAEPAAGANDTRNGNTAAPSGWSIGGATPEWGPLDLTGGGGKLPPPGSYDAVIADIDIKDTPSALWAVVSFQLDGVEASPRPEWGMIASRNGPVDQHRIADGMRLLNRLAMATRTPIEAIKDPFELPALFIGKPVSLVLVHKERDSVPELVVRTIHPR